MPEKKKDKRKLYFLGLILPSPYFEKAVNLKQYFSDQFNSKAALRSPPHITLHMPFKWNEEKEKVLISTIQVFAQAQSSINIEFNDFGCFRPRVIFVNVGKSEQLENLQRNLHRFSKQELNLFNANYKEFPFHPHVTVAFRDLKKANFTQAWQEFAEKKFEGEFTTNEISLLKHNGKEWEVYQRFLFGG